MEFQVHWQDSIDRRWRALIDWKLRALANDFPELQRTQVTIGRTRYHRSPLPEICIVAEVPSATIRVSKTQSDIGCGLSAALDSLARELTAYHRAYLRFRSSEGRSHSNCSGPYRRRRDTGVGSPSSSRGSSASESWCNAAAQRGQAPFTGQRSTV
jgi:hypothetical protein